MIPQILAQTTLVVGFAFGCYLVTPFSWRLKNKLFGWHYVSFVFAGTRYIRRAHYTPDGQVYVYFHGVEFMDLNDAWRAPIWVTEHK